MSSRAARTVSSSSTTASVWPGRRSSKMFCGRTLDAAEKRSEGCCCFTPAEELHAMHTHTMGGQFTHVSINREGTPPVVAPQKSMCGVGVRVVAVAVVRDELLHFRVEHELDRITKWPIGGTGTPRGRARHRSTKCSCVATPDHHAAPRRPEHDLDRFRDWITMWGGNPTGSPCGTTGSPGGV